MSISAANYVSISALVRGVEARLRSADVFDDLPGQAVGKYFGRQPAPGRPPSGFGQWYASIRWAGGRGADPNPLSHDLYHAVVVTLTARLGYAPKDRQGIRLTTIGDFYDLVDMVAGPNIVHGSYDVLAEANKLIPGTAAYVAIHGGVATVNGFMEPLVLGPLGPEREEGPEWVRSETASDVFVCDIRFEQSRRIRMYAG